MGLLLLMMVERGHDPTSGREHTNKIIKCHNVFIIFDRVGEATLIGAEGITSEGSYTWSNQRLLIDSALVIGYQNPTLFLPLLVGSGQNS